MQVLFRADERRRKYSNMLMILLTLLVTVYLYSRAEYLILDTVKVQRPPFSVVEVDRAKLRTRCWNIQRWAAVYLCLIQEKKIEKRERQTIKCKARNIYIWQE